MGHLMETRTFLEIIVRDGKAAQIMRRAFSRLFTIAPHRFVCPTIIGGP